GELDGEQALRAIEGEHEVLSRPALPDLPTDAVPDLVLAALAELPGHECEPARELLAVGERIPDLVVGGTQVAAQQHGHRQRVPAHVPGDGSQLGILVEHADLLQQQGPPSLAPSTGLGHRATVPLPQWTPVCPRAGQSSMSDTGARSARLVPEDAR